MFLKRKQIKKCVKNKDWQIFRKSLKGLSTKNKIKKLKEYRKTNNSNCSTVRVINYRNALKRANLL